MGIQGERVIVCDRNWTCGPISHLNAGLLPLLQSIQRPTELKNFAGQTLGVDAYGWLHRGIVACTIELAQGKPTRK
jgi:hypothetical protein